MSPGVSQRKMIRGKSRSLLRERQSGVHLPSGIQDEDPEVPKDDPFNNSLLKFSSVAAWSTSSSTMLVSILIEKQEDYWKPMRKANFWKEVSLRMLEENYGYTETQCENHLDRNLKPSFKDFTDSNTSGTAAPWCRIIDAGTRNLMDLMQTFMGHCVTVKPKQTFAAGFKACASSNSGHGASASAHVADTSQRMGLNRATILKRKSNANVSLKERQVRSAEMRAKALMLLARSRTKSVVMDDDDSEVDDDL